MQYLPGEGDEGMSRLKVRFTDPKEAADFVNRVERYPYAMDLSRGSVVVDAKSLLGILVLGSLIHLPHNIRKLHQNRALLHITVNQQPGNYFVHNDHPRFL